MTSSRFILRTICVLLFMFAVFLIILGFEMMGIAVALIGLFLYPSNQSKYEHVNDNYQYEREDDNREDESYDASDGADTGGDSSD